MRKQQYVVKLSGQARSRLEDIIRKGKSSARLQLRARILLHADTGKQGSSWNDVQISEALGTYPTMCARVRRQWMDEGLEAVLSRKTRATPPNTPYFRRREGSQADRAGLLTTASRAFRLDAAAFGEQGRGTKDCRSCQ